MSLVKKLQSGTTIDRDALNTYINEEIATFNLKGKDERKVRERLGELIQFAGKEGNTFSIDPVVQKYTITGAGSEAFTGSPDEIKSNWFTGNLKIKNPEDANSLAAVIYGNAIKRVGKPTERKKEQLGLGKLTDYMIDKMYGSPEAFDADFIALDSDEARQAKAYEGALGLTNAYLEGSKTNTYNDEYIDLDKISAIREAIEAKDWDKFKVAAHAVHWNPSGLLLSPEQRAAIEANKKAEADKIVAENKAAEETKTAEEKLQADTEAAQRLMALGFTEQAAKDAVETGFVNVKEDVGSPDLQEYLSTNNAFILYNQDEQTRALTTDGNLFNITGREFDEYTLPSLQGIAWSHNDKGILEPTESAYRPFDTKILFPNIAQNVIPEDLDYNKDIAVIQNAIDNNLYTTNQSGEIGQALGNLVYHLNNNPQAYQDRVLREKIKNLLKDYNLLLQNNGAFSTTSVESTGSGQNSEMVDWFKSTLQHSIQKEGGVLKAQNGMTFREYRDMMEAAANSKNSEGSEGSETTKVAGTDVSDTWSDMSDEEKALRGLSIAGVAGSFVPGYGAIGAGVTLGADIAADVVKDGFQWDDVFNWNTAANLGFVALSFVGLGGVKALLKTGKIAKELKIGEAALKGTHYAESLTKAEYSAMGKVLNLAEKTGAKNVNELAVLVSKSGKADQAILQKGLEALGKVAKNPTPFTGVYKVDQALGAIRNTVAKIPAKLESKVVKNTLRALAIAPGAMALPGTLKTGFTEGWEYTKPEDIKSIFMAGMVGRGIMNERQILKAMNSQNLKNVAVEGKTIFKLGEKEIVLSEMKKPRLNLKKGNFKQKVLDQAVAEGKLTKEELTSLKAEIDALKYEDIQIVPASTSGGFKLGLTPKETGRGSVQDLKDYNLAKEYVKKYRVPKPRKIRTPEQWKEMQDLKNAKVGNITNKQLSEEIKAREAMIEKIKANKKSNPLMEKTLAKRKQQLEEYLEKYKEVASKRKGGILKAQWGAIADRNADLMYPNRLTGVDIGNGGTFISNPNFVPEPVKPSGTYKPPTPSISPQTTFRSDTTALSNMPSINMAGNIWGYQFPVSSTSPLPWSPFSAVPNLSGQIENHEYVKDGDYLKFVNGLSEHNFSLIKDQLNKHIIDQGGKFSITNLKDFQHFATDKKYGPVHDWVFNNRERIQDLIDKRGTPSVQTKLTPRVATTINSTLPTKQTTLPRVPVTTGNTTGVIPNTGTKNPIRGWDPANAIMYANTFLANQQIGRQQRQAIADSMYTLPFMPHTYLRVDKPYSLLADKTAGNMVSKAARVAKNTSDLDKGNAVRLQGQSNANAIIDKGQQQDMQRMDKLRNIQLESNSKVDTYNAGVLGKNKGLAAEGFKNIHLVNGNETLAQSNAFNKLIAAESQNAKGYRYKSALDKYWNTMNDPGIKTQQDLYTQVTSAEEAAKVKAAYDARVAEYKKNGRTNFEGTYEESAEAKGLQDRINKAAELLNLKLEPARKQQNWLNLYQSTMFMKSGGKLTKKEKREIADHKANVKANNKRNIKQVELMYKAMLHDDEMLQKSLIKIFK